MYIKPLRLINALIVSCSYSVINNNNLKIKQWTAKVKVRNADSSYSIVLVKAYGSAAETLKHAKMNNLLTGTICRSFDYFCITSAELLFVDDGGE